MKPTKKHGVSYRLGLWAMLIGGLMWLGIIWAVHHFFFSD